VDWKPLKAIPEVQIASLKAFTDDRGSLTEFWRNDELRFQSAAYRPAMGYVSWTKPGQIRGPHEHKDQTDLFIFAGGQFELSLWAPSSTERKIIVVGAPNGNAVVVPPGVVHGYKCVGYEDGMVINLPNRLYAGHQKKGEVDEIRHEDDPDSPYKIPE
jgi:dTDP-4-dehydrorhamnose 3,5-epimerase